jgi:hypothetical protein
VIIRVFRARIHPVFAGPRRQEAVIEPEEEHLLAEVFCDHYESVATC